MLKPPAKLHAPVAKTSKSPALDRDRHSRAAQIVLIIATVAVLWPVCTNEFTSWDDSHNISENPWLNPVTPHGVLHFWAHPFLAEYIPLSYTLWEGLAGVARVSPDASGITLNPYVFHSANLLLHVAAVLVAFQLFKLLTGGTWAAATGALLFALHPIQVEPVAWITGLKDVLCGTLSLLALWQYVLFARSAGLGESLRSDRMRAVHYAVATAAVILAMLAKPSAVTVPLAALILDRFFLRRSWRKVAIALAPWLVLAFACGIFARAIHSAVSPTAGGPLWSRPLLAGAALAFYFYKLVWPAQFAVIYRYSPEALLEGHWIYFAWTVPFAVAMFAWVFRKRWPWLPACAALSLVATLPVLGLTPFQFEGHSLVADRYFYFAMVGPALALAWGLASTRHVKVAAVICAAYLVALGVRANLQIAHWHDSVTLFTHELAVNPTNAVAYNTLGVEAATRRDFPLAERLARESIRLQPRQIDAYITLGNVLVQENRIKEAMPFWLFAYEHNPDNPTLLIDIAGQFQMQSNGDPAKLAEAERLCRRAVEIDPLMGAAHDDLAIILSRQSHFEEALREAQIAVQLNPGNSDAQTTLASLLEHNHQHDLAVHHAMQAIQFDPGNVQARQLLDSLTRPPR